MFKIVVCFCLFWILFLATAVRTYASPSELELERESILAYNSGQSLKAIDIMKQAIQLYPQERKNPNLLTDLAIDYSEVSQFANAIYYAKRSLDINPKHVGALVEVGDA